MIHGNLDAEKYDMIKDCAAADMLQVRMVLYLGAYLGFTFRCAHIKASFIHSGPIKRQFYVRPPRDFPHDESELWKLLKLPYGMREAGQQWLLRIDD